MIKKDNIVCIDILYNPDDQVISNVKKYHNLVEKIIVICLLEWTKLNISP